MEVSFYFTYIVIEVFDDDWIYVGVSRVERREEVGAYVRIFVLEIVVVRVVEELCHFAGSHN